MVNYNYFYNRLNNIIKVILISYIILCSVFSPCIIYAQTTNAWSVTSTVRSGLSSLYTATKNVSLNGALKAVTSNATLLPVATDVAVFVGKNVAGLAVLYAVSQLVGAGVTYYHDAQALKYVYTPNDPNHQSSQYYYMGSVSGGGTVTAYSLSELITKVKQAYDGFYAEPTFVNCFGNYGDVNVTCSISPQVSGAGHFTPINRMFGRLTNPNYVAGSTPPTSQSLSYSDVANKIISNAQGGNFDAKNFIYATADSAFDVNPSSRAIPYSQAERQFERNVVYPVTNGATVNTNTTASSTSVSNTNASSTSTTANPASATTPNPASSTTTNTNRVASSTTTTNNNSHSVSDLDLPNFCDYASVLCGFFNWAKDDTFDESTDTKASIASPVYTQNFASVQFSGSCPPPQVVSFSVFGGSYSFSISYSSFCDFCAVVRPFVLAGAYISASYIILGLRN